MSDTSEDVSVAGAVAAAAAPAITLADLGYAHDLKECFEYPGHRKSAGTLAHALGSHDALPTYALGDHEDSGLGFGFVCLHPVVPGDIAPVVNTCGRCAKRLAYLASCMRSAFVSPSPRLLIFA